MRLDELTVGQALPKLAIPITVPLVAGGAIATRDYFPGHHDLDAARALGSPHIFMNILTTTALVQRYVEGWAGTDCRFKAIKIKLGAPNYPGDTMTFTASVTDVTTDETGCGWAGLEVTLSATSAERPEPRVCSTCSVRVAVPTSADDNPWSRRGDQWKP